MNRIYLNEDWLYCEDINNEKGEMVRIPHTTKEVPFNYFSPNLYEKLCSYTKTIHIEKSWQDKALILTFEAVGHKAHLYINKKEVLVHNSGYTAFSCDISEFVDFGKENEIYLKVDSHENLNIPPFGHLIDYMTYGGIYRDVYLEVKNKTFIEDVFIFTENVLKEEKTLNIKTSLSKEDEGISLEYFLFKKGESDKKSILNTEVNNKEINSSIQISDALLWDTENPNVYSLQTKLIKNGEVIDTKIENFGFRKTEFKTDGFYLNDKKVKLRGVNRHQAYAYVGYAMPKSAQVFDAKILKEELGVNAVRTSHYAQSHYFIDACDDMGILVFTEIPGWQYLGDSQWKEQVLVNVKEMVMQYRNHPSIFIWGTRVNESPDDLQLYTKANAIAKELDPFRNTGGVRNIIKGDFSQDVYTYNDFSHVGKNRGVFYKKEVTPDTNRAYLITEYNGHMFPTKSYDNEEHRTEHALRHARVIDGYYQHDDISGGFAWCMYDYNTHKEFGSGDNICHHGVMDMFRNKKLASEVYASQNKNLDVLQISSNMNIGEHPGGYLGDIYLFTNADYVKFYKNDELIKTFKNTDTDFKNMPFGPILIDDLVGDALIKKEGFSKEKSAEVKKALHEISKYGYEDMSDEMMDLLNGICRKYSMQISELVGLYISHIGNWGGELGTYRFDAYKDEKLVKTLTKEPILKFNLVADSDKTLLVEENSYDVASVRIKMCDQNGNVLEYYNEPVMLSIEGDAQIIGPKVISLKGGMGGTYIKTIKKSGKATLTVKTNYDQEATINFEIKI